MRMMKPALLAMTVCLLTCASFVIGTAQADYVPPIKGNDTGGIISYNLRGQVDFRHVAADHCAQYGKVPKLLGTQAYYGGYVSFACKWVRVGAYHRPLRVKY